MSGTTIEVEVGGPTFGVMHNGDEILEINGGAVTEASISEDLRGSDLAGSTVSITFREKESVG